MDLAKSVSIGNGNACDFLVTNDPKDRSGSVTSSVSETPQNRGKKGVKKHTFRGGAKKCVWNWVPL